MIALGITPAREALRMERVKLTDDEKATLARLAEVFNKVLAEKFDGTPLQFNVRASDASPKVVCAFLRELRHAGYAPHATAVLAPPRVALGGRSGGLDPSAAEVLGHAIMVEVAETPHTDGGL